MPSPSCLLSPLRRLLLHSVHSFMVALRYANQRQLALSMQTDRLLNCPNLLVKCVKIQPRESRMAGVNGAIRQVLRYSPNQCRFNYAEYRLCGLSCRFLCPYLPLLAHERPRRKCRALSLWGHFRSGRRCSRHGINSHRLGRASSDVVGSKSDEKGKDGCPA